MKKWLHSKLNASLADKMKMEILAHLEKFQKDEGDRWANDMLTMPDMLGYNTSQIRLAMDELISCGYARASSHRASQFYVTEEGKQLRREYSQFTQKWLLNKVTWWFKNHLEGLWKIVWMLIFPIGIAVTLLTKFDVARSSWLALKQTIAAMF